MTGKCKYHYWSNIQIAILYWDDINLSWYRFVHFWKLLYISSPEGRDNFIAPEYGCITPLRILILKQTEPHTWERLKLLMDHGEDHKKETEYQNMFQVSQFLSWKINTLFVYYFRYEIIRSIKMYFTIANILFRWMLLTFYERFVDLIIPRKKSFELLESWGLMHFIFRYVYSIDILTFVSQ